MFPPSPGPTVVRTSICWRTSVGRRRTGANREDIGRMCLRRASRLVVRLDNRGSSDHNQLGCGRLFQMLRGPLILYQRCILVQVYDTVRGHPGSARGSEGGRSWDLEVHHVFVGYSYYVEFSTGC
ncbi:hypothetical protein PM082_023400, partial [Marasmius tenuissimus]